MFVLKTLWKQPHKEDEKGRYDTDPNSEKDSIMTCATNSSFKTGLHWSLSGLSNHKDSHISFDKNWVSRFKSEITSFWIWTLCKQALIL